MLKDIALLVQIAFYIIGATIAILTYRSAKRGLLNTVNTEYQKRVMDHLHELSETLYSEFFSTSNDSKPLIQSDNYDLNFKPYISNVANAYREHHEKYKDFEDYFEDYFKDIKNLTNIEDVANYFSSKTYNNEDSHKVKSEVLETFKDENDMNKIFKKVVQDMSKHYRQMYGELHELHKFSLLEKHGMGVPVAVERLTELRARVVSDPFLPNHIAQYVADHLDNRREAIHQILNYEVLSLREFLLIKHEDDVLTYLPSKFQQKVDDSLSEKGYGYGEVIQEVYKIRGMIKAYLESFDPLK
ncbi:hypothetical protein [Priestia megaterium]|uniref:hypothetical protein n=1 Tax=Priestia megaterium TaxID=1404 RepID=UPI0032429420